MTNYTPIGKLNSAGSASASSIFDQLNTPAVRPTVTPSIVQEDGIDKLLLQSEAYVDNLLIVSDFGDDSTGEVGQINQHFASIEAAINAAPTNATILVFGNKTIAQQIRIDDGRRLLIVFFNSFIRTNITDSTGLFIIENNSSVTLLGQHSSSISLNGYSFRMFTVNNSILKVLNFEFIRADYIINSFNSEVYFKNNRAINSFGNGSGTSAFRIEGGEIFIEENFSMYLNQPFAINAFNNALVSIRNTQIIALGMFLISNIGVGCQFYLIDSSVKESVLLSDSVGCIYTTNESVINIENSQISTEIGKVIKTIGTLNINRSYLVTTGSTNAIEYVQSNAAKNRILDSTIVGGASNLDFTGSAADSSPLVIDSVRSNNWTLMNTDPQIIEGNVLINTGIV